MDKIIKGQNDLQRKCCVRHIHQHLRRLKVTYGALVGVAHVDDDSIIRLHELVILVRLRWTQIYTNIFLQGKKYLSHIQS